MRSVIAHLYVVLLHLGGFGLLALGFLDSSFLVLPFGNDLLMIAIASRKHALMPYYAVMAAAGSVLGCFTIDLVSRKEGEKGLEKLLPAKRLRYVKTRIAERGAWALSFAALMPPPFPFTAFVAGASALQYPRKKLFGVIATARFVRFATEGILAIVIGRHIIKLGQSPIVEWGVLALIAVSIVASVVSVYSWVKRSNTAARGR